jgi:Flp pilus assembly protein TadG
MARERATGHRRAASGQAFVELALCVPVLTMLVLGGVLVAHYAHTRQLAVIAAQEGARVASAEGRTLGEGAAQAAALLAAGLGRRAERFAVTPRCAGGQGDACAGGAAVAVRVRGDYPLRLPWGAGADVPIDVEVSMYKEAVRPGS